MNPDFLFTSTQIVEFLDVADKHGCHIFISADTKNTSKMFSALLLEMARSLRTDQADLFHREV